ncbi:hypothetical protein BJV74DRAFT_885278 [Russula compacta]|nr:hypothetical protein BJV74DRAFT_885278 [Russula compacta]
MSSEGNEHNTAKATIAVDPPSRISNDAPHRAAQAPPPNEDQTPSSSRAFSHPGAKSICENALDVDEQPWRVPAAQE